MQNALRNNVQKITQETGRRLIERVKSHSGKDLKSYLFKYTMETNHKTVTFGQNFHAN